MDFLAEHKPALAVTGAVALPFPFPAWLCLSVVTPAKEHGLAAHYIKIVQVVGEKQFNTWFVERKDLRDPGASARDRRPGPPRRLDPAAGRHAQEGH